MGTEPSRRLLVVSQNFPPDAMGNASRVHDNAKRLVDEGWDVTVVTPPPAFPHGEFEQSWRRKNTRAVDGITVHELWAWQPTREDPSFASRLAYYLTFPFHAMLWLLFNFGDYDAVFTTSPPIFTGVVGLPFGALTDMEWVVDVRDLWIDASVGLGFIEEGSLVERASRTFERLALSTADLISVTTERSGDRIVDLYGVSPEKIIHVPNGVDTDEFAPDGRERDPVVIYTGNVGHAQNLEACVRAMAHVDADATLRIVGDGDLRPRLERVVADLELGDRVEFTGLVDREAIPPYLRRAAVGLAPLKEGSGLEYAIPSKTYEYMASGLPVVATGRGEIERLIEESGAGVVVENDPEALAATFDSLLADASLRESYGEAGRAYVTEHFDRTAIARRLSRRIASLVE